MVLLADLAYPDDLPDEDNIEFSFRD